MCTCFFFGCSGGEEDPLAAFAAVAAFASSAFRDARPLIDACMRVAAVSSDGSFATATAAAFSSALAFAAFAFRSVRPRILA